MHVYVFETVIENIEFGKGQRKCAYTVPHSRRTWYQAINLIQLMWLSPHGDIYDDT